MGVENPPYLTIATEVSAKYKGAFCEAKVKKINRQLKCKVTFENSLGTAVLPEDHIRGNLRVGGKVEAKHPEKNQYFEAVISKILDLSLYTVVFDDGDETTLRRTSLCLKSGRHFAESETLDQLPLTNPEHFGTPVLNSKSKRKRRPTTSSAATIEDDESSDDETPQKKGKESKSRERDPNYGKVVCYDFGDKRKKDNWFPALVVAHTAQESIKMNPKQEFLVRSFKDGKYYQISKKDVREFTRDIWTKVDNPTLKTAVERALQFLHRDELPPHWDRELLMGLCVPLAEEASQHSESDLSDDEPSEEKDHFVAQLYKFMDDRGTPINKGPTLAGKDLNLYKLFKTVQKMGGYNRVTNHNQWKTVYQKMHLPSSNTACSHQTKMAYKRYLQSFEDFYRKLGCTMVSNPRSSRVRHRSERSFLSVRSKEKPISTVKEKGQRRSVSGEQIKKEKESSEEKDVSQVNKLPSKLSKDDEKQEASRPQTREEVRRAKSLSPDKKETKSSSKKTDKKGIIVQKKSIKSSEKHPKTDKDPVGEALKENKVSVSDTKDCVTKKKASGQKQKNKKVDKPKLTEEIVKVNKQNNLELIATDSKKKESLGRRKRKIVDPDSSPKNIKKMKKEEVSLEKCKIGDKQEPDGVKKQELKLSVGDKIKVRYGRGKQHKTYEAKIIKVGKSTGEARFYVHYTGWNGRYDEWLKRRYIVGKIPEKMNNTKNKLREGFLERIKSMRKVLSREKVSKLSVSGKETKSSYVEPQHSVDDVDEQADPDLSSDAQRSIRSVQSGQTRRPFTRSRSELSISSLTDLTDRSFDGCETEVFGEMKKNRKDQEDSNEQVEIEGEAQEGTKFTDSDENTLCSNLEANMEETSSAEDEKIKMVTSDKKIEFQQCSFEEKIDSEEERSNSDPFNKEIISNAKEKKDFSDFLPKEVEDGEIEKVKSQICKSDDKLHTEKISVDDLLVAPLCKDSNILLEDTKLDVESQVTTSSLDSDNKHNVACVEKKGAVLCCGNNDMEMNLQKDGKVSPKFFTEECMKVPKKPLNLETKKSEQLLNKKTGFQAVVLKSEVEDDNNLTLAIENHEAGDIKNEIMIHPQDETVHTQSETVPSKDVLNDCESSLQKLHSSSDCEEHCGSEALQDTESDSIKQESDGLPMKPILVDKVNKEEITPDILLTTQNVVSCPETEVQTNELVVSDGTGSHGDCFDESTMVEPKDAEEMHLDELDIEKKIGLETKSIESAEKSCDEPKENLIDGVAENSQEVCVSTSRKESKKKKTKLSKQVKKSMSLLNSLEMKCKGKGKTKKNVEGEDIEYKNKQIKPKSKKLKEKKKVKEGKSDNCDIKTEEKECLPSVYKFVDVAREFAATDNTETGGEKSKKKDKKKKESKKQLKTFDPNEDIWDDKNLSKKEKKRVKKIKEKPEAYNVLALLEKKVKKKKKGIKSHGQNSSSVVSKILKGDTATESRKQTRKEKKKKKAKLKDLLPIKKDQDSLPVETSSPKEEEEEDKTCEKVVKDESLTLEDNEHKSLEEHQSSDKIIELLCEENIPSSPSNGESFHVDCDQDLRLEASSSVDTETNEQMNKISHTNADSLFSSLVEFSSHLSLMNSESQNKPDAYTVLENTPPTTPETLESVASNSPAYEQYGSSIESVCTSTETESTGETKASVVLECEDSYSQDDSTFSTMCTNNGIVTAGASGSTGKHSWSNSDATWEYPSRKYRKKAHKHNKGKHSLKIPKEDSKSTSLSIKHVKSNAVSNSSPSCDTSRSHWTPRFNFCVPLDDYKDADERIAILQEKLSELKKTYMALKAEVALIDRRRKKAKKKEKEADGEASNGPSSLSVPLAEHQLSS
ncbi:uncharacterized protein LOC143251691 isoform X2 [Tachypleus tridentatus]|uniref:uncharacterized protein LOC143251691 isoform X2 n=1 Tax=Tachypleus tridentatus TaxID=6853 RepID=UPI003FD63620